MYVYMYIYLYIYIYISIRVRVCIFVDISEQWEHNPPSQYLDVQLEDSFLDLFQPDFRRHLRYHRTNDSQRYVEAPTRKNSQTPSTSKTHHISRTTLWYISFLNLFLMSFCTRVSTNMTLAGKWTFFEDVCTLLRMGIFRGG